MVAKATAAISASRMEPPSESAPPPTDSASSGEATLPFDVSTAEPLPVSSSAAAPNPSASVIR
jgi:hypothetical protein